MSGIEVAGIALAVFPIVVDGLSHFVEGVQTMRYWRRYRIRLQDYANIVESHKVYYLDTLDELLEGIIQSEDEMSELMADPGGPIWKKSEYEERLKRRLGRSYQAYVRTLRYMVDALKTMCEKLGVNTSGKIVWDDYSILEREIKRLKVTLSWKIYDELLAVIDKANKDIRDITHQNIYLEPIRRNRGRRGLLADLKLIRTHAASLSQVLFTGKACTCGASHMVSLQLELRPSAQISESRDASHASHSKFRLLLSNYQERDSRQTASECYELEVVSSTEFINDTVNLGPLPASWRVSVAPGPASVSIIDSLKGAVTHFSCESITGVRGTLYAANESKQVLGFLVDGTNKKHKYLLHHANTIVCHKSLSKSLGHLLSSSRSETPNISLTRGDRLQIAVTLASSVLQLDGTSWLNPEWTSNDIFFHIKNDNQNYSHPYLPWRPCCASGNAPHSLSSIYTGIHMIRSEVLFSLGLTLVELCFGRTLAEMQTPEDSDFYYEAVTKFNVARRLLHSVDCEMGDCFGNVVRRCLFQSFDVRDMSFENEYLQKRVFDEVVTPLLEDLENFKGLSRIR